MMWTLFKYFFCLCTFGCNFCGVHTARFLKYVWPFPVLKVFIIKGLISLQTDVDFKIVIELLPMHTRKTKIKVLKIVLFCNLENLAKFKYVLHLLYEHDKVMSWY